MNEFKTDIEITNYKNTKSDFTDFTRFEVEPVHRAVERSAFINNLEYTPKYNYPKLDFLIDNGDIVKKKQEVYEAVMELESAKDNPGSNVAELELFAGFHESRLKKIMLVEAARNLDNPISMSDTEVNRRSFAELNEILYGEFDKKCYLGMMNTEIDRTSNFRPKTEIAAEIKSTLESLLCDFDEVEEKENPLIDNKTMQKLHDFVMNKYADILSVVPGTTDDVRYNVTQCVDIMNNALEAGGLANCGWVVVENSNKSNPSTNQAKKSIFLPSNTNRNASELRRLIIHEQEVHARRAQNGAESKLKPITLGTADYMEAEEGLGVILECAVDGNLNNPSFDRARNRYIVAGLAIGADGKPRDAREVYEIVWRMISIQQSADDEVNDADVKDAKNKAYTHVENAYRGTQFWMKGVIYTKLKVYYEGLAKNAQYFMNNIDNLDEDFEGLFIGKYDHTNKKEKTYIERNCEVGE